MAAVPNCDASRPIHFLSLNAKGMNTWLKRQKIWSYLQQLKSDIIFLQETHLKNNHVNYLKRGWVGQVFHSQFNAKARGTAILIHKDIPFQAKEVVTDNNGRYVIVSGQLFASLVIMINIYAPNYDDGNFFDKLFSTIPSDNNYNLIIGGDFNCVLNTTLDRSSNKPQSLTKSARVINGFISQYGVSDIWRFKFNNKKVFSFFSNTYHSYTRIDYFLLDNRLLGNVTSCSYHSITISDHGAVSLYITLPNCYRPSRGWRLNPLLLADEQLIRHISSQISFLETNTSPEISHSTLWETLKVYLRGQIIEYSSRLKKARESKLNDISRSIAKIDSQYSSSPTPPLFKERLRPQTEYNLLSTDKAAYLLSKAQSKVYESGDKASKLLAQQARQTLSSRLIPKIHNETGELIINHAEINNVFRQYYSNLYSSGSDGDPSKIQSFFDKLTLPSVTP